VGERVLELQDECLAFRVVEVSRDRLRVRSLRYRGWVAARDVFEINRAADSLGSRLKEDPRDAFALNLRGIVRAQQGLKEAEKQVSFWCRYALAREFTTRAGWELQNLLTIARLMIEGALARDESRGTHFRSDFPKRDDARWGQRHVVSPKADVR